MRIGPKITAPTHGTVADYHRPYDPVRRRRWLEMRTTRWLVSRHPKMDGMKRRQWIRRVVRLRQPAKPGFLLPSE